MMTQSKMATKTLCIKGVVCFSPVCFLLFTFYVLFVGKKEGKRIGSAVGASVRNFQRKFLVECASNFYPGNESSSSCLPCPVGHFSFRGWIACIPFLDCGNIALNVRIRRRIGIPGHLNAVKKIYLADWFGYDVVFVKCAHKMFEEDCLHGMRMTEGLQGSQFVVQLIGICYENLEMVTAFYHHGSAERLDDIFKNQQLQAHNTLPSRFQLCMDYVKILEYLHNSPLGTRVMCDSNDIQKTLSQYLITDEFHLLVGDLDALPEVRHREKHLIKCGHRELLGSFVAPEQLWPFKPMQFSDEVMPGYDEKIDIWRIPNVIDKLLGRVKGSNFVRRQLLEIHEQCKLRNPQLRPSASSVLKELHRVRDLINSGVREEI